MSNLVEVPGWEAGIYQIETTDPVEGGPAGVTNTPARQLANRTAYLKQIVEAMDGAKQPLDATLTALAALALAADKLIYATADDAFATCTLTAFARTLLAGVDAGAMRTTLAAAPLASPVFTGVPAAPTAAGGTNTTQLATTAFVQAALAALVNSSPAALDTLNELAAALGNDANFAATMTAALAGKQPLDADLSAIAALASAANKLPYATGAGAWALADLSAFARTLLDDADAAAMRATLGIVSNNSVGGTARALSLSANGTNATVNVAAAALALEAADNSIVVARNLALAINVTAAGANGLDTGALAASTWYSVWAIWNGVAAAGLISLSESAPTLPGGYTHKARVGWIRTDGTGNKYPLSFRQRGRRAQYVVAAGSNVPAVLLAASGVAGSTSTPTWVAVSLTSLVPPTAHSVEGAMNIPAGPSVTLMAAPNAAYGSVTSTNCPPVATNGENSGNSTPFSLALESTSIYWACSGANGALAITGWEDDL